MKKKTAKKKPKKKVGKTKPHRVEGVGLLGSNDSNSDPSRRAEADFDTELDNDNNMAEEITVEELKENLANILAGVTAQNGFRKSFVETVVRKNVADVAVADALVAELNAGFDKADGLFDTAAKAEAEEVDLPPASDNEELVKNLFE